MPDESPDGSYLSRPTRQHGAQSWPPARPSRWSATPPARCAMSRPRMASCSSEGKTVTGFTNGEEGEVGLTKVVPFLVEDEMMTLGAIFSKVKNWSVHTVADGQLITGQNPASSGPAARLLIDALKKKAK